MPSILPAACEHEVLSKIDVLAELEPDVRELMASHEAKRTLWLPSEVLAPEPDGNPDRYLGDLRARAEGIGIPERVALCLNTLTEEGLPHFHRLLSNYLGTDSVWSTWNNLWTAEEDRHGCILHDYMRITRILDNPVMDRMQFDYLKAGFEPRFDRDPYRVLVYTTLQERVTQVSHTNTGRLAGQREPVIGKVLGKLAMDEARHFAFYREIFRRLLTRDPNRALESASLIVPSIDMPGVNLPDFAEMADVQRRAGIYGPRDYVAIVREIVKYWGIDALTDLDARGRQAQARILAAPDRLARIADRLEARRTEKTFSFAVAFAKEFEMG